MGTRPLHDVGPMQPVWVWDGAALTGWASTSTRDPKVDHLRATPRLSLTDWEPGHDTCTADCEVTFVEDDAARADAWRLFRATPPPAGFDPAVHPEWDSAASATWRQEPGDRAGSGG
jgi:hypothetical protein